LSVLGNKTLELAILLKNVIAIYSFIILLIVI